MDQNKKPRTILETLVEELIRIITPVSICMLSVVILVKVLNTDSEGSSIGLSFTTIASVAYSESSSDSIWDKLKAYLVVIGMLVAYLFTLLPEWTTWVLLIAVALYDLAAVCLPGGPLRLLVELAISRDEDIPALVYEARPVINNDLSSIGDVVQRRVWRERRNAGAIKLGLGDFIFYSVLVGRAAMYDFMTVYACYLAIIAGLGVTLILLAVYRKALPALPVSIMLGVLFYLLTRLLLEVFVVQCSLNLLMF
ncbi:unnamed protein product [Fraxinus pennsylvanica]|uniref:Presenilin n=1 Tax=Fraxinus pennsylvanica TaxID=56036 RepID=A0AAD2AEN3_9LAMI|nr:unnamed protein product [Fraxinus pennsylvanica]